MSMSCVLSESNSWCEGLKTHLPPCTQRRSVKIHNHPAFRWYINYSIDKTLLSKQRNKLPLPISLTPFHWVHVLAPVIYGVQMHFCHLLRLFRWAWLSVTDQFPGFVIGRSITPPPPFQDIRRGKTGVLLQAWQHCGARNASFRLVTRIREGKTYSSLSVNCFTH
jgi:hypothetical protein